MIEFILSMAGLAMALYAVWISSGVTSCQQELKAMERKVERKTQYLYDEITLIQNGLRRIDSKAEEFEQLDQEIKHQAAYTGTLTDRFNELNEKINQSYNRINTVGQKIRGELADTHVSVEELKIQLIKYQAEQQRMQSAMKENRDALVKWFGGEL